MTNPGVLTRYFQRLLAALFCFALISCGQTMSEQEMLLNAKSYIDKDELMAASIELRNILQKNRENAEARYLLGAINLQIGDLGSAEKEFRRAASAGWNREETQTGLARIFLTRKDLQKMLDEIVVEESWTAEAKANISALRAMAFAGSGQLVKAQSALDQATTFNADALYVLKATAMFQLAGIKIGNAADTLEQAISLYPDNPELLLLQASSRIQNDRLQQAAESFEKVISLDPPKIITANGRIALIGLARLQIIDKNIEAANSTLARLLKRNDKDPDANYLAGLVALNQQNYHLAEEYIRKLLAVAPDHVQSQHVMGKIKYAVKDFDQAAHYLATYLNANPEDIAVRKLLTNTYIILNQPELANETLQGATAIDPDDPEILTLISQIEFNKGDLNAGILSLNKAIESSPESIQLHKQLAKAYIATGNMDQALDAIKHYHMLSKDTMETQKLGISAYLKMGDIDKAIGIAARMLDRNPQDPDTIALNGSLYAAKGDHALARNYFNQALELNDSLPSATVGLARLEASEGNYDRATALYKKLVDSKVAGTVPMLALAEIAAQQNKVSDMLAWLEQARRTAPTETRPRIILANYYLSINQPDKADSYVQEALKLTPEQADLQALHGRVLIAQKQFDKATPLLKQLLTKVPDAENIRILLSESYLRQGMLKDARTQLKQILETESDNAMALTLIAETEFNDGNYEKSLQYTKQLQQAQPELYLGYVLEGNVWLQKKDLNKAHAAYQLAWQQQQTAELAMKLFATSRNVINFNDAISPLLSWMEAHPDDHTTRFYLATTYQNADKYDLAIAEYEKILKDSPDNMAVLNNLAWLYSLKDDPRGLDYAEKAYRLTQSDPGILDTYGWILVKQGKTHKGMRLLQQAIEQIPDNLEVRYHYAVALIQSDNKTEGQQILESLIKLNKPFVGRSEAQQLLARTLTGDDI